VHTLEKKVGAITYYVIHSSDWSGKAMIQWDERGKTHEITLPGEVLAACGRDTALRDVLEKIEDMV